MALAPAACGRHPLSPFEERGKSLIRAGGCILRGEQGSVPFIGISWRREPPPGAVVVPSAVSGFNRLR